MRVVVQRCSRAEVRIDGERVEISTLRLKNQN
jgi:D-Tyr-tRNAtyr deacylase